MNIRKIVFFIIAATFFTTINCFAKDLTFEDFTYTVLPDKSTEIIKFTGEYENISIPSIIEGHIVTSIGASAFNHNEKLTSVTIPDSVIYIGDHAFSECTSLQSVVLPDDLLSLGELVFQGDVQLESITLPATLLHMGMNPFDRCDKLTEIGISEENNFYSVENGVLYDKRGNKLITYPAGKQDKKFEVPAWITDIDYAAFSENNFIEEITLSESIKTINGNPFCGCLSLKSIHISPLNSNYEVYSGALFGIQNRELIAYLWNSENETYTVPQGTRSIAQESFYKHKELKSIELPKTVISIKDAAFAESGLEEIKIPENVIGIGNSAFSNCADLKSVTLPAGLSWIGNYAFYECNALAEISFPKSLSSIGEGAFFHCTGLSELVFPDSLHYIGNYAFLECTGIKSIDFSSNLYSIGGGAFYGIEDLTVKAEPGSLGEEWAIQNNVPVEHKNVEYLPADIA